MSGISISPHFPFRRINIIGQAVNETAKNAVMDIAANPRFEPVCHQCGRKASSVHSWIRRQVRDLNLASTQVGLQCACRKLLCAHGQGIRTKDRELNHPHARGTQRLAIKIHCLCKVMTASDVARHVQLDRKTVRDIDKNDLEAHFGRVSTKAATAHAARS